MISYAQNFEDVMLARCFGDVPHGFYIDVGAWDPDRDSVTRHFYESGWSGINIEPGREYFGRLARRRPRDVNLQLAVSDREGTVSFHEARDSGLSGTTAEVLQEASRHRISTRTYEVRCRTLASLCDEYVKGRDIHFLKVDVEGHERAVLAGADWSRHRPWVVLVEAITPQRQPAWEGFEPLLLEHGYVFAWHDGLNRFYVRRESAALLEHFKLPPNVFDTPIRFPDDQLGRTMSRMYGRFARFQHAWRSRR